MINFEKLNRKSVSPRFQEDLSVHHTSISLFNISDTPGGSNQNLLPYPKKGASELWIQMMYSNPTLSHSRFKHLTVDYLYFSLQGSRNI